MWRRSLVAVALCAASRLALAQPSPQQQQSARDHFNRAQAAEKDGRYRDAIDDYEQAYALVPHADVLFNIAFDYEKLDQWTLAADYYQRYLDERPEPPADAANVRTKIRDLRAKAKPARVVEAPPPPPPVANEPEPPPNTPPPIDTPPTSTTTELAPARWHLALSYGYAFGDAPSERYAVRGGVRFAKVVELDGVLGSFGNNDYAAGLMTRVVLFPDAGWSPFLRGTATIGYARQDASSTAQKKFPFGVELGGGVQFGRRGRFELDAVVRWLSGGWDAASTTADSYVNDTVAFGIDLGLSFDVPIMVSGR